MKRLLLFVTVCLAVRVPCFGSLAASDLVTRARTLVKDASTSSNRQQFTDSQFLAWASDGQREANAMNWLLTTSTTFTLSGGTTEYAMPSDFMFATRVWYQTQTQPMMKLPASSFNDLDARYPGWQSQSGGPAINYYMDMSTSVVYMGFYPAPVSSSTGPVIVYYVQSTIDMSSSDETKLPFNGWTVMQPYASALPYYMAYRAYLTLEEEETAKVYYGEWAQFLLIMRQGVNRQPDFNPAAGALRSGSPSGMGGL